MIIIKITNVLRSASDVRAALAPVVLACPPASGLDEGQGSLLAVTAVLVQAASVKELRLQPHGLVQQTVRHSDAVDLVTVDQGVGEPVEQVLGGQQGHALQHQVQSHAEHHGQHYVQNYVQNYVQYHVQHDVQH